VQVGLEDMVDCASRAPINILELKFNYLLTTHKFSFANELWLKENGYVTPSGVQFSDAFVAIISETTREGNSLKSPLDAVRKHGLVPKHKLPLEKWMRWADFHNPHRITDELIDLGAEFAKRFYINYEKVYEVDYVPLLKKDALIVAGYAWSTPKQGVYPRSDNDPNHAFILFGLPAYLAFDNYVDPYDNDFIKQLAPDSNFMDYGYRILVNKEKVVPQTASFLDRLLNGIKTWFREIIK
jgi:hypothetical protein